MLSNPEAWSAAIAGLALVLSLLSLLWQWSSRRCADPVVSFTGLEDMTYLTVENFGSAIARDVSVEWEIPAGVPEPILQVSKRGPWPIPLLAPSHPVSFPCFLVLGVPSTFETTVRWRDGRIREQSRRVTLGIVRPGRIIRR